MTVHEMRQKKEFAKVNKIIATIDKLAGEKLPSTWENLNAESRSNRVEAGRHRLVSQPNTFVSLSAY